MERVKAESVSSTASSPDIPNLGKGDDNREHVIESIPSKNPVLIEKTVQTDTTTRRNTKLNAKKAQSTLKRKKEKITKKKSLGRRGLVQSHSPGSVVPTINQTTIDVNAGKGETHSTENQDWKLLHSAVRGGNVAIIETVLARGLDIESKNSYGSTPLMVAALNCKMEVVNYLLDKGADPSLTGEYGKNLLHFASQGGNVAIIETMLSRGLDVNSKDSCGNTPTMFAASSGKIEAVNYLLDRGADLSLTSKNGKNLLHMASFGGNVAIIETMLSHGLNVNSKDNRGDTPSTIAADNGDAEAVNYLLSRGAR
ncbi:hypothetical protein ACROYT_G038409 [Oculina patagonica]